MLSAILESNLTVQETFNDAMLDPTSRAEHDGLNEHVSLDSTAITKVSSKSFAMSGGVATINLAAIPGTNGGLQNGTGLKVQAIKIRARPTNDDPITVTAGASDGIDLFGANWSFILSPGQSILANMNNLGETIGSTNRTIDISGTGTEVLEISLVMG